MSLEDLRNQGVILPEEEWGEHKVATTVNGISLLIAFVLAVVSVAAAYLGNGQALTWIGIGGFFLGFFAMIGICDLAIRRQRRRFKRERREVRRESGPET